MIFSDEFDIFRMPCAVYTYIWPLKYMSSYAQVHGLSVVPGLVNKVCLICCTVRQCSIFSSENHAIWLGTKI